MYPLKQSTAITVPFFAHDVNGDGVTGIVDASWTKRISKDGGIFAAMTVTITEMENGWYSLPLSTLHTDTLGLLTISLSASGAKRVNLQFRVFARILDDLAFPTISGRSLDVDVAGGVEVGTFQAGAIGAAAFAVGAIDASAIATDAIGSAEFSQAAADKVWSSATRTLSAFSTALAVSVWDVLESAIALASSIGLKLKTNLDVVLSTRAPEAGGNIAAIKIKTDNLPEGIRKNQPLANFEFLMVDSADHVTPKTGLTVTGQVSLDGAAFVSLTNIVTELSNGIYKVNLAAADLNGDVVTLRFTATGADARLITIKTGP